MLLITERDNTWVMRARHHPSYRMKLSNLIQNEIEITSNKAVGRRTNQPKNLVQEIIAIIIQPNKTLQNIQQTYSGRLQIRSIKCLEISLKNCQCRTYRSTRKAKQDNFLHFGSLARHESVT